MAKAAKTTNRKAAPSKNATAKATPRQPAKKAPSPKAKAARSGPKKTETEPASFEGIAKLIDHPLVADLLAIGAIAAVAAIADHNVKTRTGEAEAGSSKAVKAAGKAAAAAIGKRLLTEVDEIRKVSKPAKR